MPIIYQVLSKIPIMVQIKKGIDKVQYVVYWLRKEIQVVLRSWQVDSRQFQSRSFSILCVKRLAYVDLVIRNINSLHFHNPKHTVQIFADTVCAEELTRKWKQLDYPSQVTLRNEYTDAKQPWQYLKIETLIAASKSNSVLIDADSMWFGDPHISKDDVTFLVAAYPFKDNHWEKKILNQVFQATETTRYLHYVTGLVSIPSVMMTKTLENRLRRGVKSLFTFDYSFIGDKMVAESIKRLSEEIVISYVVQESVPYSRIRIVKESDGPGNKQIIQSLYYGCSNIILE